MIKNIFVDILNPYYFAFDLIIFNDTINCLHLNVGMFVFMETKSHLVTGGLILYKDNIKPLNKFKSYPNISVQHIQNYLIVKLYKKLTES